MKLETYLSGVEKASWAIGLDAAGLFAEMAVRNSRDLSYLNRRRRQCAAFKAKVLKMAGNGIPSQRKSRR